MVGVVGSSPIAPTKSMSHSPDGECRQGPTGNHARGCTGTRGQVRIWRLPAKRPLHSKSAPNDGSCSGLFLCALHLICSTPPDLSAEKAVGPRVDQQWPGLDAAGQSVSTGCNCVIHKQRRLICLRLCRLLLLRPGASEREPLCCCQHSDDRPSRRRGSME